MSQSNNIPLGIMLMIATTMVFAVQDGLSRHLAENYNVLMVVMIRYWFFAAFVIALALRKAGGIRRAAATTQPAVQILRGVLLSAQICTMVLGFTILGLVESHAVFTCYPLLVAALSGPILGEKVGWRRWAAIGVGFVGVLVILQPGYVARRDNTATSFFWTGVTGAVVMTAVGVWFWEPMTPGNWLLMGTLCITGVTGHWLLIRCYEVAEASAVQPFAYTQLIFTVIIGLSVFNEVLRPSVVLGAGMIVAAGLFTLWRERLQSRSG